MDRAHLVCGDSVELAASIPSDAVHAIVTDPPYGLEFMGAEWDSCARGLMEEPTGADAERLAEYAGNYAGRRSRLPDLGAGTVADTFLEHGTGALNVDGSRVACAGGSPAEARRETSRRTGVTPTHDSADTAAHHADGKVRDYSSPEAYAEARPGEAVGRWPPNVLLSHLPGCEQPGDCAPDCAVAELDRQSGRLESGKLTAEHQLRGGFAGAKACYGDAARGGTGEYAADAGGASRFFPCFRYVPKPDRGERDAGLFGRLPCVVCGEFWTHEHPANRGGGRSQALPLFGLVVESVRLEPCRRNAHPTVKPVEIMAWLATLVTQPGGLVWDPFMGSGTTAVAVLGAGFRFLGTERDAGYAETARVRATAAAGEPVALCDELDPAWFEEDR